MVYLLPNAEQQFADANGAPLAGGTLDFYIPGTLTRKDTYSEPGGTVLNTNPVVLDAAGRSIIYGTGDYRCVLRDAAGNLIWDQQTSAALKDSATSSVMLPVVGAATLQSARDLLGVTSAIATAIAGVSVVGGATGATGAQGVQGIQGIQGPAASPFTTMYNGQPGYWIDSNSGLILNFGSTATDSSGRLTVNFPKPFPNGVLSVVSNCSADNGAWWVNIPSWNQSYFNAVTSSPLVGGSLIGGPMGFQWLAVGF